MKEKNIIITDSTHLVENSNPDIVKYWRGSFIIYKKDKTLNVSENVVYFKYAYMHSWFGYYFALSCLFSDDYISSNKDILDDHEYCEIKFIDSKGSFTIKGKPFNKTITSKQLPNTNIGNVTLHQWTCVYYSEILLTLDKEPKIKNKDYDLSKSSIKQILNDNGYTNPVYYTQSITEKADANIYKLQKSTVKNKSLKESILNILSNLKINDNLTSVTTNTHSKKKNKHVKKVDTSVDAGHLYPFRMGTNTSGDKLFVSYYKDMLDKVITSCSLLCSFTEGGLSNKCLQSVTNVNGVKVFMSTPLTYSLSNDYTDYIYSSDKCFLDIDYSYQSTKLLKKYKLQDILNLKNFFQPSNYIVRKEDNQNKVFKFTTTYSDRQKCASTLLNAFYSNAKYVFRTEEGLLPTTFFTFNNGNIMWALINLYHVAIINKIEKNSGAEVIKLPSQINGVIIEMQPYAGKSGLLTMTQYISLSRPALFKHI